MPVVRDPGAGPGSAPRLRCPILIRVTPARCVLRAAVAGGREMIKAAFDEAKINKQAGNCAGLYLLQDDGAEPAPGPGPTSNGRAAPAARGPHRRLFSDGFFLVPAKPGRSVRPLPRAGPRPRPAGAGGTGCHRGGGTCRAGAPFGGAPWRSHLCAALVMLQGPIAWLMGSLRAGTDRPGTGLSLGHPRGQRPELQAVALVPGPYRPLASIYPRVPPVRAG